MGLALLLWHGFALFRRSKREASYAVFSVYHMIGGLSVERGSRFLRDSRRDRQTQSKVKVKVKKQSEEQDQRADEA